MTKKALITGLTGQDGSYLAEVLPFSYVELNWQDYSNPKLFMNLVRASSPCRQELQISRLI
jgi:GDP-D-mannose dehydratase